MKSSILFLALFSLLIALSACEGGTTFTKTVENQSSESISLKVFSAYGSNSSTTINPDESVEIFIDDKLGSFTDTTYHCTQELDSIQVMISDGKTLVKDIMNSENWTSESKGGRNSREDCTFVITNEDIN